MGVITEIEKGLKEAESEFNELLAEVNEDKFGLDRCLKNYHKECYGQQQMDKNIFFWGDNLEFIKKLLQSDKAGKVQLVYIDPPFFSKSKYHVNLGYKGFKIKDTAYTDIFTGGLFEYVKMLALRFMAIKFLLSDTGSVWVHLDWHSAHYAKIIMDEIFGIDNFVNEIIWSYKSGGSSKRSFSKKHDTLLFYSKTKNYYLDIPKEKSYNRDFRPYRFKNVCEYEDEVGWYTLVNMKDVWQLDMLGRTSKERTGYRTQKPESLMRRIIESCSKEGDICIDFFAGSGSFPIACSRLNRVWFASDFGTSATGILRKRMLDITKNFTITYKYNKKVRNILDISIERFEKNYIIKLQGVLYSKLMQIPELADMKNILKSIPNFNIEKKDQLIDCWGIYDIGKENSYKALKLCKRKESGALEKTINLEESKLSKDKVYAILAVDIFGNVYEEEMRTEG